MHELKIIMHIHTIVLLPNIFVKESNIEHTEAQIKNLWLLLNILGAFHSNQHIKFYFFKREA